MQDRGLDVGSIQDLNQHNGHIPLSGLGGRVTEPLGYVMLRVQKPYMPSYDEDWWCWKTVISSGNARSCWEHQRLIKQSGQ